MLHLHHVVLGHTLRDAHDERDFRIEGFDDGSCGTGWWHIDNGRMGIDCLLCLRNGCKDGQTQMLSAALLGRNAANELGAILQRLLAVEGALFAGESLADDARVAVQLQIHSRLVVLRATAYAGSEAI